MARTLIIWGAAVVLCATVALAARIDDPATPAVADAAQPTEEVGAPAPSAPPTRNATWDTERASGITWLVQHQGADGGWGAGNWGRDDTAAPSDVATTVIATLALARDARGSDGHRAAIDRGVLFVVGAIEQAPQGPLLATPRDTQPQRKLGQYVDTHMAAMLLGEVVGGIQEPELRARVNRAYDAVLGKVQMTQQADGSFEISGWAPILSSSMAIQSLIRASEQGKAIDADVVAKNAEYQVSMGTGGGGFAAAGGSAGVELYGLAATAKASKDHDRLEASAEVERALEGNVAAAGAKLRADASGALVRGFGSMGGEEMLAYMMISDTLAQDGGADWTEWERKIGTHLASIQNADGSWSGHHCITSTTFVTAAALVTYGAGDHAARR